MGCDIVFKINGDLKGGLLDEQSSDLIIIKNSYIQSDANLLKLTLLERETKEISLKNIAQVLMSDLLKKNELITRIQNLKNHDLIQVTKERILKNGIIGNYKYHTLKVKYAGKITFPNLKNPVDIDILLVDKLSLSGYNNKDVIFGTNNDKQIFVVEDSENSVKRLNNYLIVRDLILSNFTLNSELEQLLPELAKVGKKFKSLQELLLDFISRESEYKNLLVDKGLYGRLKEIVNTLKNSNIHLFEGLLDRDFKYRLDPLYSNYDYQITINNFINLVKTYDPELIKDFTSTQLKDKVILSQIFEKFYENFTEFSGKLVEITDKCLIIHTNINSLENNYGFTYSTISEQVILEKVFKGYNIYKYSDGSKIKYMYSQDVISPKTITNMYNSIEEVENIIKSNYETKETFNSKFEKEFRIIPSYERVNSITTQNFHAPGSIVKVLDIEINGDILIDPEENSLFTQKKLLKDFYDIFKKQLDENQFQELIKVVDSIETAGIFTYLINEKAGSVQSKRNLKEGTIVKNILSTIDNAKKNNLYKLFFIESCNKRTYLDKVKKDEVVDYTLKLIPIKSEVLMNTKYSRPEPIIGLMNEIIDKFNEKFNIGATLLTQDEIAQQFPDIPANTRAFIRNGNIYVNGSVGTSTDVIHEYTHLFLGVLKALNYDMYVKLLDKIASSTNKSVIRKLENILKRYPNLANQDIQEELFVDLFAEFLSGKNTDNMFVDVKAEIDLNMKNIFNFATEEDFNSLYKGHINKIFQIFSKDIGKVGNGLDFSRGTIFRQAANWISKQMSIKDENGIANITERC